MSKYLQFRKEWQKFFQFHCCLFSGYELETLVCGSPDIPLNLLKSVAT
jgi:hypothetical protein